MIMKMKMMVGKLIKEETFSISQKLMKMAEKREHFLESSFKKKVLLKIKCELKTIYFKHITTKFLLEAFGEILNI